MFVNECPHIFLYLEMASTSFGNNIQGLLSDGKSKMERSSAEDGAYSEDKPTTSYKEALSLNKKTDNLLSELESKLLDRLNVCKKKLKRVQYLINTCERNPPDSVKNVSFSYYKCGIPFFKDRNLYSAPPNVDVQNMKFAGIANYSHDRTQNFWTSSEKKVLVTEIGKQARDKSLNECSYNIKKIEKDIQNVESTEADSENSSILTVLRENLREASEEMNKIKHYSLAELVKPLDCNEEFDWSYMENGTRIREAIHHKARECRSMWRLFLHPQINKAAWNRREERQLTALVKQHQNQDWDSVARCLNTQRSPYQCFLFYRLRLSRSSCSVPWTLDEDEYLKSVVESCRIGNFIPWAKVAYHVENRTKEQIYNRWVHQLCVNRRGRFSEEEDNVMMAAIREHGLCFNRIAELLPGRSTVQVKVRYRTLESYRNQSNIQWTFAEDRLLLNLVTQSRYSSDTIDFTALSKQFLCKTAQSVRNRFRTLEAWLLNNPYRGLSRAPRRKVSVRQNLNLGISLAEAIKQLQTNKKSIKKPTMKKKTPFLSPRALYSQFVDYFKSTEVNYITPPKESVPLAEVNIPELRTVLLLLGAKLDKNLANSDLFISKHPELKKIADSLLNSENDTINISSQFKSIKTYSRKKVVNLQSASNVPLQTHIPSIWEERAGSSKPHMSTGKQFSHVLPASLSTVSAFRTIMLQKYSLGDFFQEEFTDYQLRSKEEPNFDIWRSRFEILFTWPANLSNIPPLIKTNIFEKNNDAKISCNDNNFDKNAGKKMTSRSIFNPGNISQINKGGKNINRRHGTDKYSAATESMEDLNTSDSENEIVNVSAKRERICDSATRIGNKKSKTNNMCSLTNTNNIVENIDKVVPRQKNGNVVSTSQVGSVKPKAKRNRVSCVDKMRKKNYLDSANQINPLKPGRKIKSVGKKKKYSKFHDGVNDPLTKDTLITDEKITCPSIRTSTRNKKNKYIDTENDPTNASQIKSPKTKRIVSPPGNKAKTN